MIDGLQTIPSLEELSIYDRGKLGNGFSHVSTYAEFN